MKIIENFEAEKMDYSLRLFKRAKSMGAEEMHRIDTIFEMIKDLPSPKKEHVLVKLLLDSSLQQIDTSEQLSAGEWLDS